MILTIRSKLLQYFLYLLGVHPAMIIIIYYYYRADGAASQAVDPI